MPTYRGCGRPLTQKQPQLVKLRENERVIDTQARLIYGTPEPVEVTLGQYTAYVERTNNS